MTLTLALQVGDQIIEINSHNTTNMMHSQAIDLISNGGSTVRLLVKRTGKLPPQLGKLARWWFICCVLDVKICQLS